MGLRAQILKVVHPDSGGPRSRRMLDAIAIRAGKTENFVQEMIARGELVQYGDKKGAKWGLPR